MDVLQLMDGTGVPGTAHVLLEPEENMATRALPGQEILIAVIDSGVEYTHPALGRWCRRAAAARGGLPLPEKGAYVRPREPPLQRHLSLEQQRCSCWSIINGNDPFSYGEKVKAYLRRGAKSLPAFGRYPNEEIGYGVLCVRDSLPV